MFLKYILLQYIILFAAVSPTKIIRLAYWDSKVPKRVVGLIQMQCSPSLDCNWGKQNDCTACWHQLHPQFRILQQGKCLSYPGPPDWVGGSLNPQISRVARGCTHFEPLLTKGGLKTINFFSHFNGLISDSNYNYTNIWSAS